MRRNFPDGQLHVNPSTFIGRMSLRADPPGGSAAVEIPKDLDPKVIDHIKNTAVEEFKGKLPKPPEKYTVKLPDTSMLPKEVLERTTAKARELGLTTDAHAQAIIDLLDSEVQSFVKSTTAEHSNVVRNWEEQALKAPDLGNGRPEVLQAHVARVKRVLNKYFPESARKLLDEHGIGSNPDFIRGLSKIADAAKEDAIEVGNNAGGRKGSAATRIYPSHGAKQ